MIHQDRHPEILRLHATGISNCAIADQIGACSSQMTPVLRKYGLLPNGRRGPEIVSDGHAKCKTCKQVKPLTEWATGCNPGKPKHYLSTCSGCWNAKIYRARNASLLSRIKYKRLTMSNRARREGIEFQLTVSDFLDMWHRQGGRCFYADIPLTIEAGRGRHPDSMSVDRIIPDIGYLVGNVVLAADRINTMKQDATLEEMRMWMPEWHRRAVAHLGAMHQRSAAA